MSQAAVEQVLGRLLTDARFRESFFAGQLDPLRHHYPLTDAEIQALSRSLTRLNKADFGRKETQLDDAICRAVACF